MDDSRLIRTSWREAGRSAVARSGKLLFGLGMAARLPETAFGARKNKQDDSDAADRGEKRRAAKSEEPDRDNQSARDAGNERAVEKESGQGANNRDQQSAEEDTRDRSAKQERREDRSNESNQSVNAESSDAGRRSVSRKQEADDASDEDAQDEGRGGRRSEELEQNSNRDDEPATDDTLDDVPAAPAVPSNPTIPVSVADDPTDVDQFIEANPDVIASTSASGGFAFARSGNVIAVSGPDGATLIQTGDPDDDDVSTPSPSPTEPSDDGGNNDVDFTS